MFEAKKPKINMAMIQATSKMSLKMSSLAAANGDIDQADKLYDYLTKDIAELPDFDQPKPTAMQQFKQSAEELFGWFHSHGDDLAKGWNLIQSIRNGGAIPMPEAPPANIPPIPQQ